MYDADRLVSDLENDMDVVFTEEQAETLQNHADELLEMAWDDMTKPLLDDLRFFCNHAFKGKLEKYQEEKAE